MAATVVDNVKIKVLSAGTGALQLGGAVDGYRGQEALINGQIYNYAIRTNNIYEIGQGTYLSATGTLSRSVQYSSNGNGLVTLPPNCDVSFVALAADLNGTSLSAEAIAAASVATEASAQAQDALADISAIAAPLTALPTTEGAAVVGTSDGTSVQQALDAKAPLAAPDFTLSGSFTYGADFFNPTDDYVRSDCMVRATDSGSHPGRIRFGQFISAHSGGTSPNGPANAFVGLGVSNLKTNFLTSTSTQETDGLFVQTKTGRFGDTSAILADAWAINVPGVSTSFSNLIEGAAGCFNTSGVPVSKIRFQAANQYQAGTPGTIEGVGCHIIAEVGTQTSALDISNTAGTAAWTNAFRLITDTGIKHHILGNGYTGINGIADSQIPLLINAHPDGLTQRHYFAENGAGLGPVENFFRYSLSPANNDLLGSITFDGMNSAAAQKTFASIRVQAVNVGSGTEQGGIFGFVTDGGSLVQSFAGFRNSFYISGPLFVNNTQVLGPRATGWSADTGTAKRTANATYSATAGASYSQAQIQALMDAVRDATQTIKAVKDDLITHHGAFGA